MDVSGCVNLTNLSCSSDNLTSIDFLKQLPHPEKISFLQLANNNIEPTNLEFLRPFVNLTEKLTLGNDIPKKYNNNIYNRFYGSLEPLKNMTKLRGLCIDGTDVEEGIEYLPVSIWKIDFHCSLKLPDQKVAKIQNQLRPYNYDIEAWQLAHPEKMLISHPEYFTNPNSKEQWLQALKDKIKSSQEALDYLIQNEPNKVAKIVRLETQIEILKEVVELEREIHQDSMKVMDNFYQQNPPLEHLRLKNILQRFEKNYLELNRENQQKEQENKELKKAIEITEKILEQEPQPKQTQEQGTQTNLTGQDYEQQQKENQALKEQLRKLTIKN